MHVLYNTNNRLSSEINTYMLKSQKDIYFYEFELSSDCNAECPLCERTMRNMPLRGNNNISLEQIKKLFPTKELVKGKDIALCGTKGDPILAPDCLEICQYLDKWDPWVLSISTNGGYNNAEWWTELGKLENVAVDFCIDGHEKTNHLYRVNVKWDILMRNLKAFIAAGGEAKWIFIPFDHNEHEFELAKATAKELGIPFVKRNSARNAVFKNKEHTPRKSTDTIVLKNSESVSDVDDDEAVKSQFVYRTNDIEKQKEYASTIVCRHLKEKHVYIHANFTLSPCCWLARDQHHTTLSAPYNDGENWNDLNKHTIDEIILKKQLTDIQSRWNVDHPDHLRKCVMSCGNKGASLDKNITQS